MALYNLIEIKMSPLNIKVLQIFLIATEIFKMIYFQIDTHRMSKSMHYKMSKVIQVVHKSFVQIYLPDIRVIHHILQI